MPETLCRPWQGGEAGSPSLRFLLPLCLVLWEGIWLLAYNYKGMKGFPKRRDPEIAVLLKQVLLCLANVKRGESHTDMGIEK